MTGDTSGLGPLLIASTHPVQYHAPVYQALARSGVPVLAVFGSDYSVAGSLDREFGAKVAWDTDLLSGYDSRFLSRVGNGGAKTYAECRADGLDKIIDEVNPAAILLHGYACPFDRGAILLAKASRRPILFRAETTDHTHGRAWWKAAARDWKLRRLYRSFDRLLYIGSRSKAHYERLGVPAEKLIASRYCVNTAPFATGEADRESLRKATRADWNIPADRLVILFSGKLSHRKGVDLLPEAIRLLPPHLSRRITLAFLGDGELRAELEAAGRLEPALDCRFLGFQNQTKLSGFYHAADLLALPSRRAETWGLVVNEALHHGLPVVVSDAVGCAPDLVREAESGAVFRKDDLGDLTLALKRALSFAGLEATRAACRAAVEGYTVTAAAEGVERAFREVKV